MNGSFGEGDPDLLTQAQLRENIHKLELRMEEKERDRKKADLEVVKLCQRVRDKYENKVANYELEKKRLLEELEERDGRIKELLQDQEKLSNLESEMDKTRKDLRADKMKNNRIVAELEAKILGYEIEKKQLMDELEEKDKQINKDKEKVLKLENEKEKSKKELKTDLLKNQEKISEFEDKFLKYEIENKELRDDLERKNDEIEEKKKKNMKEINEIMQKNNKKFEQYEAKISKLEKEKYSEELISSKNQCEKMVEIENELDKYRILYENSCKRLEKLEKEKEIILKEQFETRKALRLMTRNMYKEKYENQINSLNRQIDDAAKENEKLKGQISLNDNKLTELEMEIEECRKKYTKIQKQNDFVAKELESAKEQSSGFLMEVSQLKKKLQEKEESYDKISSTADILKTACIDIETQADGWRKLYEDECNERKKIMEDWESMTGKVHKLENELKSLQDELKSVKESNKKTVEEMQDRLDKIECESDVEKETITSLQQELDEENETSRKLREEAIALNYEIQEKNTAIRLADEKCFQLEGELIRIKEEAAQHITVIGTLKSTNKSLSASLSDMIDKYETSKHRINMIMNEMEAKEHDFTCEQIKLTETISQHKKLIEHLQNQNENKGKKNWLGHINSPMKASTPISPLPRIKNIEGALNRERMKNMNLTREIDETKAELLEVKKKLVEKYEFELHLKNQELDEISKIQESLEDGKVINTLESFRVDDVPNIATRRSSYLKATANPSAPSFYSVVCEDDEDKENDKISVSSDSTTDNNVTPRKSCTVSLTRVREENDGRPTEFTLTGSALDIINS